jgi:hypothetical protein
MLRIETVPVRVIAVSLLAAASAARAGETPSTAAPSADSAHLDTAPAALDWKPAANGTTAGLLSQDPQDQATSKDQPAAKDQAAPTTSPTPAKLEESAGPLRYGDPGSTWVTLGGGAADNGTDLDENIFARFNYFIAKDVEMFGEVGAWQFSQEGKDSTGFNLAMVVRWHFYDDGKWTLFTDVGIGILAATDPVPRREGIEGTNFDFTPRAGGGFTRQLTDDGVRLEVGLRWAHVSNARISGNNDNPGRDSLMLYAGLIFPF